MHVPCGQTEMHCTQSDGTAELMIARICAITDENKSWTCWVRRHKRCICACLAEAWYWQTLNWWGRTRHRPATSKALLQDPQDYPQWPFGKQGVYIPAQECECLAFFCSCIWQFLAGQDYLLSAIREQAYRTAAICSLLPRFQFPLLLISWTLPPWHQQACSGPDSHDCNDCNCGMIFLSPICIMLTLW